MNVAAYKRTISRTEAPRQIERRVLAQITSELEAEYKEFDSSERRIERLQLLADGLRHSLWKNERLWGTFKVDLMEANNGLTSELRSSLISLALWVETHTQGVMSGGREIYPLIDINRSVISGLDGRAFNDVSEESSWPSD